MNRLVKYTNCRVLPNGVLTSPQRLLPEVNHSPFVLAGITKSILFIVLLSLLILEERSFSESEIISCLSG